MGDVTSCSIETEILTPELDIKPRFNAEQKFSGAVFAQLAFSGSCNSCCRNE
jgi:hypothetical protein